MDLNVKIRCFDMLELPQDSSWPEIRTSYINLKKLYSSSSIATMPVEEDLTDDRKEVILHDLEEAYQELETLYKSKKKNNEECLKSLLSKIDFFNGSSLKNIREKLDIDLLDISLATNIQLNHLKNIEKEDYKALPREVYTRGHVMNYAKYIGIDPSKVADNYMQGYHKWNLEQAK